MESDHFYCVRLYISTQSGRYGARESALKYVLNTDICEYVAFCCLLLQEQFIFNCTAIPLPFCLVLAVIKAFIIA